MEAILNADFDIDNPEGSTESTPVWARGDYYAKITRFVTGGCEVVMKVVRPMMLDNLAEQFANGYPVSNRPKEEKSASEIEEIRQQNQRRAVRKAKQTTRFLCQQMQADRLLTVTYRENVEDREKVKADFKQFLRLVRNGWKGQSGLKNFCYVAVLERQDRGAYHVHIAVRGFQPITFIRKCWYKALGASPDATKADTPGQVDITSPRDYTGSSRKKQWAVERLSSYIVKYMQKTFDESTTEKNRYWRAKDILPPVSFRHWLVATNLGDALKELHRFMSVGDGIALKKHWLSDDDTVYWFRGVAEDIQDFRGYR